MNRPSKEGFISLTNTLPTSSFLYAKSQSAVAALASWALYRLAISNVASGKVIHARL
jgi:hypothetical protein